jgi:sugar phosphate isomerase/epimerase
MRPLLSVCSCVVFLFILFLVVGKVVAADAPSPTTSAAAPGELFARKNLVAWCIVPFDAKKRGPKERAEMLNRLGLSNQAYDWRAEHVPTFEEEILQSKQHGIKIVAFWSVHNDFVNLARKYGIKPQFWVVASSPKEGSNEEKVAKAAEGLLPVVNQMRELGCKLALYNHGGWSGEPDNLVAIVEWLRKNKSADHVGIVYNLHHGHGHLTDFPEALAKMKPYLFCLNINGMVKDGESRGQKILPLGQGDLDLQLLKTIVASGYHGPIGILNHTGEDAEARLQDNLDGLDWLVRQLNGQPAGPKPTPRTWKAM